MGHPVERYGLHQVERWFLAQFELDNFLKTVELQRFLPLLRGSVWGEANTVKNMMRSLEDSLITKQEMYQRDEEELLKMFGEK